MRSESSLSRRGMLLVALISPALLGSQFRCVAVSNPGGATTSSSILAAARIEQIEPAMPRVGEIVRAAGSGNGTPPLQFSWDFGDGTLAVGQLAAHAYMAPGSYRVTFNVGAATGDTASDSAQITVSPQMPSSVLSLVLASDAVAGEPVQFAVLPLDPRASALSYVWTFSGGQSAIGPRAAAIFPAAGTYLASVTVTNDLGEITGAQITFHVANAY